MDDKTIEIADYLLSEAQTYREARIACEKLFDKVAREIEHRALEMKVNHDHETHRQLAKEKLPAQSTDSR